MVDQELKDAVHRYLLNETDFLRVKDKMNEDELRNFIDQAIGEMCRQHHIKLNFEMRAAVIRSMVSAAVSLGPLRPLMEDRSITEIMVNGAKEVYIQKDGHILLSDIKFEDEQHLLHTIHKILSTAGTNKRVDESSPYCDFSLSDGSRVNVIIPPCSMVGPVMTIRKFKDDIQTVEDLLNLQMFDSRIANLLTTAMKAKLNVIFCGATGAGKTTALNVFSRHIPSDERIITIEDTPELRLLQDHVVSLCTKPSNIEGRGEITMRELFINSLRMRPDRIIIGEIRAEELLDLIQSISSGHSGSLAIVHAETPEDCFNRMVTMMLMTGIRLSTHEIQKQVARAIDLIVHVELYMDGKRRVSYVTEPSFDEENGKILLHDIFRYQHEGVLEKGVLKGEWKMNRKKPAFLSKYAKRMVKLPEGFFEK